ncbi:Alpha/Beta hydrolase protein, partial [Mycena sp. CBHHK59/15]
GDLRFRAPQPPANVTGVQLATSQPNQCFQAGLGAAPTTPFRTRAEQIISTEDCLFLSVYFPSNAEGTPVGKLPTIVWIHGGGHVIFIFISPYIRPSNLLGRYIQGAASIYKGTDLVSQSNRGIVVVTIQYRLGVFGFLPGTEVKKNGALNAGLLDQDFALRWVNKHISKFGGDPTKVTIWGESAGAGSVLQQVVANNGQTEPQLFRGVITSSTFLPSQYKYNDRIPELLYSEVVAQANCTVAVDSLACLRTADADTLEAANVNINAAGFYGTCAVVPVVDGSFITQPPLQSLLEGKVNGKALLSVTNAFEGTTFVDQSTEATANATQYALDLFPNFGPTQAQKVGALYAELGTPLFQEEAIIGESILICPTYAMLHAFRGRSFKGEFAIPPGTHGLDILYYFPSASVYFPTLSIFNNTAFINAFAQSFTSFAISLDPNVKINTTITPKWNTWDIEQTEMLFNKTDSDAPVVHSVKTSDALLKRCQFWESVGGLTGQ